MAKSRKMALELIKWDFAKHGKNTGVALNNYVEHRISYAKYKEMALIGLEVLKRNSAK